MGVCAGGLQRGVPRGGSDSQLRSVVLLRLIPNYVTLSSVVCVCVCVCVYMCLCLRECVCVKRYTETMKRFINLICALLL